MPDVEQTQIYLITPADFQPEVFGDQLARVLDGVEVACVRIALASGDADHVLRCSDAVRAVAHARDVPVVVSEHAGLVEKLGLDGVHLTDGARSVRKLRKSLGRDAIVGTYCAASRHDGLNAGESGADYVAFGPIAASPLGHSAPVDTALFEWWSEMIEVPVVAEGGFTPDLAHQIAPIADFLALGDEIWRQPDPVFALQAYLDVIR